MSLTPTNYGDNDDIKSDSSLEDYGHFLKEKNGFCPHPHPDYQDEVVEKHTHGDAARYVVCPIDTSHKHYQHEYHRHC